MGVVCYGPMARDSGRRSRTSTPGPGRNSWQRVVHPSSPTTGFQLHEACLRSRGTDLRDADGLDAVSPGWQVSTLDLEGFSSAKVLVASPGGTFLGLFFG